MGKIKGCPNYGKIKGKAVFQPLQYSSWIKETTHIPMEAEAGKRSITNHQTSPVIKSGQRPEGEKTAASQTKGTYRDGPDKGKRLEWYEPRQQWEKGPKVQGPMKGKPSMENEEACSWEERQEKEEVRIWTTMAHRPQRWEAKGTDSPR